MFVIPSLEGGGAERVTTYLLEEFDKKDINVTLVLFENRISYGLPEGVKVRCIDIAQKNTAFYTIRKFFRIILKLVRIVKEEKPSMIFSTMDYTNIVVILSNIILRNHTKTIISVHISPTLHLLTYQKNIWNKFISIFIRLLYSRADKIIAVSEFIRNDLIENFGIDQTKVVTIYNPVDINKISVFAEEEIFHPWLNENIPVVLSVGRLTKQKGFDYLLKAFAIVKEQMNSRLIILGEGEDESVLKNLSKNIGIDESIDFLGFQKNPYKYMRRSAIYVLSSIYEGFPVVLLEAMACGVPVLSTIYNPYQNEIIEHEKNGLLVPVADEKALAESMLRLLNDEELRRSLSEEAKEKVKRLSPEEIAYQYRKVLLDI